MTTLTSPGALAESTDAPQRRVERRSGGDNGPDSGTRETAGIDFELIELLFFAYRDFVGDPDRILADYEFGRAHHRVLHFVGRRPGLTIAELLDILQITKQSLNRVLKELIDTDFVEQRAGQVDRRQRLLFLTQKGNDLAMSLARLQNDRIAAALAVAGTSTREPARRFLAAMIETPSGERGR